MEGLLEAVARTEVRAAFLATGDLGACLEELRDAGDLGATLFVGASGKNSNANDRITALVNHPLSGDLIRFALNPKASSLRHRTALLESA